MENEVLSFINKRFNYRKIENRDIEKKGCYIYTDDWSRKNCYYFSLILINRFDKAEMYYDVVDGHFITKIDECLYDAEGIWYRLTPEEKEYIEDKNTISSYINSNKNRIVKWNKFKEYDEYQYKRIILCCID